MHLDQLKAHILAGLTNQEALRTNPQVLEWVHEELVALTHDKVPPAYALYDFALVRAKRYLKIPLDDEDLAIYNEALKAIKQAPLVKECHHRPLLQIDDKGGLVEVKNKSFSPLKWCKKRSFEL
ncbi:hypothetical protein NHP190003_13510 [Helicobacter sp. NHP19-003]|uniref:Uncharacterized protein n=1 Tax=Helicobacter gastrocanis TaxID=2849641 RepID=A0ABN6I3D1_9HELI|nr:hypothetical protein [Helicobacter sp. NHP19-003]BCZ18069.1 hypothetical protein NHP190003_13510 [Helicobacter sp. NHP19-003]